MCVTFKFVCFDGLEVKKLADEVAREKGERKKEKKKKEEERELCVSTFFSQKRELCVECSGVWRKG